MPRWELEPLNNLKGLTYNQISLLNHFYTQFDNRSAINRQIINIEPLYYYGVLGATEFLVFDASKLYICFEFSAGCEGLGQPQDVFMYFVFYDETGAVSNNISNDAIVWNPAIVPPQVQFCGNNIYEDNFYFSYCAATGYALIKFNGFRVTLI